MEQTKQSLLEKLMLMRMEFLNENVKKTGYNNYSKFSYYQLDDILPVCTKIGAKYRVIMMYSIEKEQAILNMINLDDVEDMISFRMPVADATVKGGAAIQNLGALMTYTKRYLYMDAFSIAEPDSVDAQIGKEKAENNPKQGKTERQPAVKQTETGRTPVEPEAKQRQLSEEEREILEQKITPAKVAVIRNLMKETGIKEIQVCRTYKVDCIESITEQQFRRVMDSFAKEKARVERARKNENYYIQN